MSPRILDISFIICELHVLFNLPVGKNVYCPVDRKLSGP